MRRIIALLLVVILAIAFFFCYRMDNNEFFLDEGTHKSCLDGALRAREGFKGTEFERWNFYESCLLNIVCANPMYECPVKEIHEQSRFFLNIDL